MNVGFRNDEPNSGRRIAKEKDHRSLGKTRPSDVQQPVLERVACDEFMTRFGDDRGFGWLAGVIGRNHERYHLIAPASVAHLALVVVEPRFQVEDLPRRPRI